MGERFVAPTCETSTYGVEPESPYEAVVRVDKERLVHRLAGLNTARTIRVFLFADALRRALARGIARFEAEIWPEAPAPLVLAILDSNVRLTGPHLSVLGGPFLSEVGAAAEARPPAADFDAVNASRDRHIGWDTQWVRALTPWHFDLRGTCADRQLLGMLRAQLVKLAVLFTCDRARARQRSFPPAEILAEYRGREHVAVVPIDEGAQLEVTDAETVAVLRVVEWCYQRHGGQAQLDWVSDRLPFVQTRIAQSLEAQPVEQRLTALARAMPYLIEGIEWHWKAFIEGKVGEYLDRVQQIEELVGDTVTAFADHTAALVKGLTDTILAAVAVLIGSFIAAAFETPFNATLFRIGLLTYAGYVLLFPGAVGLFASARSLRSGRAEFDTRIQRFNETLYPEKVSEIVGTRVADAQSNFYRWLMFVASMYFAVTLIAGLAAVSIPDIVYRDTSGGQPSPAASTRP